MKEIYLITGNEGKRLAAQKAFSEYGITVKMLKVDYPEIQGNTSVEIARHTALQAVTEHNVPVVREDHSLFIKALGGFPGPYTHFFDATLPVETLLKMLSSFDDRSAEMELGAVLALPDGTVKEYAYRVPLKLSETVKGKERNWDKILMLNDSDKTFAETDEEENVDVWLENFRNIAKELSKK